MERHTTLLAEYAEAGQVSRAHEQNVRQALNAYLVLAAAIVAVCFSISLSNAGRSALCFLAFSSGAFILNTVYRHRAFYASYVARAKVIEAELGMTLYTQAAQDVKSSNTFSNKVAIAAVFVLLLTAFGISAVVLAFRG